VRGVERLDRRTLLERGALLAGGAVASGALASCGGRKRSRVDFAKLAARLNGRLVLPASPGYERARKLWNSRFDDVRPRAIAEVAGAEDVRKVVSFARDHDLRLITRNGRHSFGGYSTGEGVVVVDVSLLNQVAIAEDGRSARLGAGVTLLPAYRALWPVRAAIPGGTCPTVGVTGLTTCGGIGYLTRRHGLTCDALTAAEIVDADGRLLRADERENADLFWALRGGGAGSFGVITSLTFRLVPVDMRFTSVAYDFPWEAAGKVLAAWQEWAHAAPREVTSDVQLVTREPGSTPGVTIEVVHGGDPRRLKPLLAELVASVGPAPTHAEMSTSGWVGIPAGEYCKGLSPQECRDEEVSRAGKLPRIALYAKSDVAARPWPQAGFDTLVEWMEKRQRDRVLTPAGFSDTHDVGKVLIEACDGAVNDLAPDATAFVHRGSTRFVSQYQTRWRGDAVAANLAWADGLYSAVAPYRSGKAYQGYIDTDLPNWGAGLLRREPCSSAPREVEVRPGRLLPLRAVDPTRLSAVS
jgi:FAD/FMN-containing dehydrogenase